MNNPNGRGFGSGEETKRIAKDFKHFVEPFEVRLSLSDRSSPLERPNSEIVFFDGRAGILGRNVKDDVRPLREVMAAALLVLHLQNGTIGH